MLAPLLALRDVQAVLVLLRRLAGTRLRPGPVNVPLVAASLWWARRQESSTLVSVPAASPFFSAQAGVLVQQYEDLKAGHDFRIARADARLGAS